MTVAPGTCLFMDTRTCPNTGRCASVCARFGSDDPTPWTSAEFSCGRCGHRFTVTTHGDYVNARQIHAAAHDIATCLLTDSEVREQVLRILGLTD